MASDIETPAGEKLILPTEALTEAVNAEMRAQTGKKKPDPAAMPMTQLAFTAIDITAKKRAATVGQVAGYASNELLCHYADLPPDLVARQRELWQPLLDWCAKRFDARLRAGQGVMPIVQPPEVLQALHCAVESYDDFFLTGLKHAAETCTSLVLGLALAEHHVSVEEAFQAAECDALFQMHKWGEDPAAIARHLSIRRDLDVCARWFELLNSRN